MKKQLCEKEEHGNYWLNPNVSNVWRKSDALSIIAFLQLHWFSNIKGFGYYERVEKRTPIITVTTDYGEHKTIILPDNTELAINSCTTVKYPEQFVGNNRIVELTGEGCFKVTHNPEKPFIVKMKICR